MIMPRFYFHLSAPDQDFQDNIGSDMSDLSDVHSRAVLLADRVMTFPFFADCAPDFRRWTVKVTDERRRPVITVIFPAHFLPGKSKPVQAKGARTLLLRLGATLTAGPLLDQSLHGNREGTSDA
jgi:hypothetical protein